MSEEQRILTRVQDTTTTACLTLNTPTPVSQVMSKVGPGAEQNTHLCPCWESNPARPTSGVVTVIRFQEVVYDTGGSFLRKREH